MSNNIPKRINQVRLGDYILINNRVCKCTEINNHITHPESGRRSFINLSGYDVFNHDTHKERFPGRGEKFISCPNVSTKKYIVLDIVTEQKYNFICLDVNSFTECKFFFPSRPESNIPETNLCKEIISKLKDGMKQILITVMVIDTTITLVSYEEID